ncbi:MAG TPA: FAD-dependent tricarballylate dehydrogenase TcuA [Burkholderiales bacterium]
MSTDFGNPDVIVVGAGNAACCAALAARENGAQVVVLESAPVENSGGNSRYTGGLMRVVYNNVDDVAQLIPDLTEEEKRLHDFGSYTAEQYFDDMGRITQYMSDPDLTEILITKSFETLVWLQRKGVRFQPSYGRQSYKIDDKRFKFWGGLVAETWGGGAGLVDNELKACEREGVKIFYETPALSLLTDDTNTVTGVKARYKGRTVDIPAKAVVLACGGFESNAEMRTRYLGPGWDLAKVRGTRYNQGAGIKMALDIGALPYGHWSGCHAVGWDRNAPPFGDVNVGDQFQKHSYPWGIMINANGERFVDEGADFRNYTYAKYGRVILNQPGMFAWQVFDNKLIPKLRDEYRIKQVTKVRANTLEELVQKMEGVDAGRALQEIKQYNAAVQNDKPFNMAIKDGRRTSGLKIDKTNWANTIDEAPFEAYAVTCGVTFSFGGLKITNDGEVEDTGGQPIRGLYAAGELVGGIFYHNYPGGTGLTSGSVFGKIAGTSAAQYVKGA